MRIKGAKDMKCWAYAKCSITVSQHRWLHVSLNLIEHKYINNNDIKKITSLCARNVNLCSL